MVQTECADGSTPNNCPGNAGQMFDWIPLHWRKSDWPGPGSGLVSDSVWLQYTGNVLSTFSTYPFGPLVLPNDGGDIYKRDLSTFPATASAIKTKTGDIAQDMYFCGTGWTLFKNDLPAYSSYYQGYNWASTTAEIGQSNSANSCNTTLSPAYTQFRLELVTVPFLIGGAQLNLQIPTIISEHWDGTSPATASNMERFYFGLNWGKYRWDLYSTTPPSPDRDLASECPSLNQTYTPGFPGWQMSDCRMWTNILPASGNFSLNQYGWGYP